MGDVTQLLAEWVQGDRGALDQLMPIVYSELRKIAGSYLRRERAGHTLQSTALVHEAWLRLVKQDAASFAGRRQFFALAARMMREILVDHARRANAEKRGGGARTVAEAVDGAADRAFEFLALDEALTRLSRVSPRKTRIIELRYFGGLNVEEAADVLGVSIATISREQRIAEAWLGQAMAGDVMPPGS